MENGIELVTIQPNDHGNTRTDNDEQNQEEQQPLASHGTDDETRVEGPKDTYYIAYIILMIQGIGSLVPWNMFMMAEMYFTDFKLLPKCDADTMLEPANSTTIYALNASSSITDVYRLVANSTSCEENSTFYRNYFLTWVTFFANVPNVIFNGVNAFAGSCSGGIQIGVGRRTIISIVIVLAMFTITTILAIVDTSSWPEGFFALTMVKVVMINSATAIFGNSIFGTSAVLGCTNAVIKGTNFSGILTAIIVIISMNVASDLRKAAIGYFGFAIVVLIITLVTYLVLLKRPFYLHNKKHIERTNDAESSGRPPYKRVFKKCWKQFLNVWTVFVVTLACFPAIMANVRKVDGDHFYIPEKYFIVVICFLFFSIFATAGNFVSDWWKWPGPDRVWIPIVIRVLFIPFFVLCNFVPKSGIKGSAPVLFPSNWAYMIMGILFAFSSGYFSSLAMVYAPGAIDELQHKSTAGKIATFFLVFGLFAGIILSYTITIMVETL